MHYNDLHNVLLKKANPECANSGSRGDEGMLTEYHRFITICADPVSCFSTRASGNRKERKTEQSRVHTND